MAKAMRARKVYVMEWDDETPPILTRPAARGDAYHVWYTMQAFSDEDSAFLELFGVKR